MIVGGGSETELAARLRLAATRLARRLRQQVDEPVSIAQLSALAAIERLGPVTLGDLARVERVQPPTTTRIVASLEAAGLVERAADPDDRRVARVSISSEGRRLIERSRRRKTAYLAARLRRFSEAERATIDSAVVLLERLVDEESP
ncbi:MAG: MarR family transcriptional regulator [Acidobacteria bacterium]|nr:MarR family transcriptional regulator [Acidobacteriota bacterium]